MKTLVETIEFLGMDKKFVIYNDGAQLKWAANLTGEEIINHKNFSTLSSFVTIQKIDFELHFNATAIICKTKY